MAATGDRQEPPRIPPPVRLEPPGTPGTHHQEAPPHFHSHQHDPEVLSQPPWEKGLVDLHVQDVEEVQVGRDACWPGE
ncbi:PREDICTED: zinc finger protein GLI4 [Myotis davidii]|uniref:zinc finger protein GLI4 n=1 Tax=Myotis davidii TaxID=225400 RepID=UPI0003EBE7A0|nr:PREDICTED: zinc finger protein GLI4 [Myotis davidii]